MNMHVRKEERLFFYLAPWPPPYSGEAYGVFGVSVNEHARTQRKAPINLLTPMTPPYSGEGHEVFGASLNVTVSKHARTQSDYFFT